MNKNEEANLGLATTEELINELIARFTSNMSPIDLGLRLQTIERIVVLAKLAGGLTNHDLQYRTVDF